VLQDRHHNLVSVITIVRWLLYGKKEKSGWMPAAGVTESDIQHASVFGSIIHKHLESKNGDNLQTALMQAGAIHYKPAMVFIEKTGYRIFGLWSKFILKKGHYNAPKREFRLSLFKYYLFAVIYLVSPIGLLLGFYLPWPFLRQRIKRQQREACYTLY
jgi:hypothetical protein